MDWRRHVRSKLPPLSTTAERETEIVDELALQLESTYERERSNGASHESALAAAESEVPDWSAFARTVHTIERPDVPPPADGAPSGGFMTGLAQDVRCALRALRRAPGFAAVAIVTLALGIAATTIVYSVVDGILLRPLPIRDADRVVLAREFINGAENSVSWPSFLDWQQRQTSFSQMAAWRGVTTNLTGLGEPRRLNARQMTWNMLATLGVTPIVGRDFTADDDQPGVERTALVSYRFWQRELGGDPSVGGRRITLDDTPVTVIGVLPPEFTIAREEDVFLPFQNFISGPSRGMLLNRGNHFGLAAIARLKDGVSIESARAEMVGIARQLEIEYPATNSGNGAVVRPFFDVLVSEARTMLYVLLGAVGAMLLIACVNLANLMLARAAGRSQEMAVRRSLGASRARIVRQMLTESLLLAIAGGALGVALAYGGFETLLALLPPNQPRIHIIQIDWRVLSMAAAVSIATGVLFGLMPALQAGAARRLTLLRSARVTGAAAAPAGQRRALLVAEIAMAVVLLTGAGLMLRTMGNLLAIDAGFTPAQLVTGTIQLPERYTAERRRVFIPQVIETLRATPGITNAAFTNSLPIAGSNWGSIFIVEGQPVPERSQLPSAAWTTVTEQYFDTMGIRLVRGRLFSPADAEASPRVAVVNQSFARRFFGDDNPIGARVKQGWPEDESPWREIVGVVNDVRINGLQDEGRLQVYLPYLQTTMPFGSFVARAGDAAAAIRSMTSAVQSIDPNLPLFNTRTMRDVIDADIGNARLTMVLLIGFAGLALLMAAIGVFGVTAYSVSQRTQELGVRMALGAQRGSVLALVLRQELTACLIGIAGGVAGAVMLSSLLESLLFGVAARDAATLSVSAIVLLIVTLAACVIPAYRATRVDPVTALRLD